MFFGKIICELKVIILELFEYIIEDKEIIDETLDQFSTLLTKNHIYNQSNLINITL